MGMPFLFKKAPQTPKQNNTTKDQNTKQNFKPAQSQKQDDKSKNNQQTPKTNQSQKQNNTANNSFFFSPPFYK